jgi:hypothetical protein
MKRWLVLGAGIVIAALVAAGAAVAVMPVPAPGHAPFHIGCKDHNHGPKWHANHGKSALPPVSRFAKPDDAEVSEPESRN